MKIFIVIALITFCTACQNQEQIKKGSQEPRQFQTKTSLPQVERREVVLGEATTEIIDDGENRINNIKIACQSISGTEILPATEFSFNSIVGERSASRGYKEATVLSNGKACIGIGGGVCQVSTTVYMAAVNAGLKIKERHLHSTPVTYAPERNDATVVYGKLDMRFENTFDENIYVYTWIDNGNVYAKLIKYDYIELK